MIRATGIGERANSGGPREVRLEVLAERSTEGQRATLAWIGKVANNLGEASVRRDVYVGGCVHIERFVWSLGIELIDE